MFKCNIFFSWSLFEMGHKNINNYRYRPIWNTDIVIQFSAISPSPTSNTCLLLCNGILAAAFLIRWICLAETFLILPLSAWTRLYSESATNLFKVRWSRLSFREIYNVFIPCPRHCTIWRFSAAERDHFSFPYCLKPVACLIVCKVLLK